jgi:hypothetical protein
MTDLVELVVLVDPRGLRLRIMAVAAVLSRPVQRLR